ncbi:MAG: PDZ domain-containing protein [Kofleriaceae bacterium]
MRVALTLAVVASLSSGVSAEPSNPAFLGIGMQDQMGQAPGAGTVIGPCIITETTPGSGAKQAGLLPNDILQSIDGMPVSNCDAVLRIVQGHEPGDTIRVGLLRDGRRPLTIQAQLLSRAEILRRRFGGQPIAPIELVGVHDEQRYDLRDQRGKTVIVGWYDPAHCIGGSQVFTRLAEWVRAEAGKSSAPPIALAATAANLDNPDELKKLRAVDLDVPLTWVEPLAFETLTIRDTKRIHFMVIDRFGIVRHVAPVLPTGDDVEAVLDELFAAAEQASRRATK